MCTHSLSLLKFFSLLTFSVYHFLSLFQFISLFYIVTFSHFLSCSVSRHCLTLSLLYFVSLSPLHQITNYNSRVNVQTSQIQLFFFFFNNPYAGFKYLLYSVKIWLYLYSTMSDLFSHTHIVCIDIALQLGVCVSEKHLTE